MTLTRAQREALHKVWMRPNGCGSSLTGMSYLRFRRTVRPLIGSDQCVMVRWCGMYLGIETDGHTHS